MLSQINFDLLMIMGITRTTPPLISLPPLKRREVANFATDRMSSLWHLGSRIAAGFAFATNGLDLLSSAP